jgi:hypothetical protein
MDKDGEQETGPRPRRKKAIAETTIWLQKNRSTIDVPNTLHTHITGAIRKKEYTAVLSLDWSKAYDTCWRHGILKNIKTWKTDGRLLGFTKNFMNDHTLRLAIDNTMCSFKNIENGVPQGAVLTVTLFLVAMAKICDKIEKPTKILGSSFIYEPTDTQNGWKQIAEIGE